MYHIHNSTPPDKIFVSDLGVCARVLDSIGAIGLGSAEEPSGERTKTSAAVAVQSRALDPHPEGAMEMLLSHPINPIPCYKP